MKLHLPTAWSGIEGLTGQRSIGHLSPRKTVPVPFGNTRSVTVAMGFKRPCQFRPSRRNVVIDGIPAIPFWVTKTGRIQSRRQTALDKRSVARYTDNHQVHFHRDCHPFNRGATYDGHTDC